MRSQFMIDCNDRRRRRREGGGEEEGSRRRIGGRGRSLKRFILIYL